MPSFRADDFSLVDPNDQSKVLQFDLSALISGSFVTLKVPVPEGTGFIATTNGQIWDNGSIQDFVSSTIALIKVRGSQLFITNDAGSHHGALLFDDITQSRVYQMPNADCDILGATTVVCNDGDVMTYQDDILTF